MATAGVLARPPPQRFTQTGNMHEPWALDPSQTGAINLRNFVELMSKIGVQPRDRQWLAELDQNQRGISNLDLRMQYNDVVVPLNVLGTFSAADNNSMNSFLYTVICPPKITEQMNFSVEGIEIFMAPYDLMNPLNIARETTYRRQMHQYTTNMYKRSQSAEYGLLADSRFGEQTLQRMQYTLDKQAELTIMDVIATALPEYPHYEMLLKYQHPANGFNHIREQLIEGMAVFAGAEDSSAMLTHVLQGVNDQNKHDSLIVPAGGVLSMIRNAGEPQPVTAYRPFYDTGLRRLLVREYENGETSLSSIPMGGGKSMKVFQLHKFKGYIDDPDDTALQYLGTRLMLGELIEGPRISLDNLHSEKATLSPKMLAVMAPNQSPQTIEMQPIQFRDYLKYNLLFLGGTHGEVTLDNPDDGLSRYYEDLAKRYNGKDNTDKVAFQSAFRDPEHLDQNTPSTQYAREGSSLKEMTGFRHYCGFLCYNDITDTIEVPFYVGDIEPKTCRPMYLFNMAEVIAQRANALAATAPAPGAAPSRVPFIQELRKILPTSKLLEVADAEFDDQPTVNRFLSPDPISGTNSVAAGGNPVRKDFLRAFGPIAASAPLVPLENESKVQYLARVTPAHIQESLENGSLSAKDSAWVHLLQHVPDAGLEAFLTLVHATLKDGQTPSEEDTEALAKFATELEEKSGREHIIETLKAAVRHIARKPPTLTVGQALAARTDPWLSREAEKRVNSAPEPASVLASTVREHVEDLMGSANLGHAASRIYPPTLGAGLEEGISRRFSWLHYNELLRTRKDASENVRLTYVALLQSRFNYVTCEALSRLGLTLFNQHYLRMFIEQTADSFVVMHAGYGTWFMAIGHGQVLTGVGAAEGSFAMHAEFRAGIIPVPEMVKGMKLLPHALPQEHRGGRNLHAIRHFDDLMVTTSLDRRSLFVLATPVGESDHVYPLSLFADPIYRAPNVRSVQACQKTSMRDILEEFIGEDYLETQGDLSERYAPYFGASLPMATRIHRAFAAYATSNDPNSRKFLAREGTGPCGKGGRNMPGAAEAFMGLRTFPIEFQTEYTM